MIRFEPDDRGPLDTRSTEFDVDPLDRRLARATWALLALGILLRVVRYLMDFPLWWDEAFVAVNFIRRDYFDLLRPLDYGQVCPILFLWTELTTVKLLGFSEWTLRLFPLGCALASVLLFRRAASRILSGVPLLLAVGIFAMAFHPIRHAADVKPYASDLLAALLLLAPAFDWWRTPDRAGPMWALAALAPLAIALSHPAVFVAGGLAAGLFAEVCATRRRGVWVAYLGFLVGAFGMFLIVYAAFTHAQATATLQAMREEWAEAFPPLASAGALVRWLVAVHTGSMFAYPCGAELGASTPTLVLFSLGAVVLWRRGRRAIVLCCLVPFLLALAAAFLRRYPYGGYAHGYAARVMQYLVPNICLLAGFGAARVLETIRGPGLRLRTLRLGVVGLAAIGIVPLAVDATRPYRAYHAERARQFARHFWPEFVRDAEPVCLRWDLGVVPWDSTNLNVAVYLCNQRIYSPRRCRGEGPRPEAVSGRRPLRCILPLAEARSSRVVAWVEGMRAAYDLKGSWPILVDMAKPGAGPRNERFHVFEFVPRTIGRAEYAGAPLRR